MAERARAQAWSLPFHRPVTAPRQILPGATYLITRRCAQRQLLLRPSRTTNDLFLYLLAVAAERYGIEVHAFCVLSNHFHAVVTDRHARLPAFHQFLDALVARALNASLGRWEAFWAPNSYSAVALALPDDVVEKAAYALANPAAAGLVRSGRLWPGLWSAPERVGGEAFEVRRPKHFFDAKGLLPEKARLELTPPPGFTAEEFRERLAARLAELETAAVKEHRDRFLGAVRVMAQKPTAKPKPGEPRRALNPRVASRDKWRRIEVLGRLKTFLSRYRAALAERCAGNLEAVFPRGTYLLRVAHGVPCEGFG
jgi:REP element-mobilizing transposase RayT